MKTLLILFLFCFRFTAPNTIIAMMGIKVNDNKAVLEKVKLKITAKEKDMVKYRTDNGDDLSVTSEKDRIVYMENDWSHEPKGVQPLFANFQFGKTSLKEIRNEFGTNGFTYKSRAYITTATDLVEFNCFEFDSPGNEVLVTITKVSLKASVTEENVADHLKLDAIILSRKDYLDDIWGKDKVFDPNYRKVKYP